MIEIKIKHTILISGGQKILDIDQKIPEESLVLVKGNSGIGKTTFFKILAGLIVPDFGLIKLNNKILLDTENNICFSPQKRNISLMFQNYALFPNMTVKQNIAFAQKEKNEKNIDEILEKFDLKTFENTLPSKLSGGQQQRVALARTLAQNASIVLLDEPFSAVDLSIKKAMIDEIINVKRSTNSICFIISHNETELDTIPHFILNIE